MPLLHTIMLFALAGQLYFFSHKTFVYYTPEVTFKTPFMASSETIEGTSSLLFLEIFGHKVENKIRPTAKTEMEKSEFETNTVRCESIQAVATHSTVKKWGIIRKKIKAIRANHQSD